MNIIFARLVVAITLTALTACSSVQQIYPSAATTEEQQDFSTLLKVSDYIELRLATGTTVALTVTSVSKDIIEGEVVGSTVTSQYARNQIAAITRTARDRTKTVVAIVLGAVATFVLSFFLLAKIWH